MNECDWETTGDPGELLQLRRMPCCGSLYTSSGGSLVRAGEPWLPLCTRCHSGAVTPVFPAGNRTLRLLACALVRLLAPAASLEVQFGEDAFLAEVEVRAEAGDARRIEYPGWVLRGDVAHLCDTPLASLNRLVASLALHRHYRAAADLVRAGVGNPFAPPLTLAAEFRTPLVRRLALAAYQERLAEVVCTRCGGDLEVHDADFSEGDSDRQMFIKQDTLRPCPGCGGLGSTSASGRLDPARLAVLSDALEEAGLSPATTAPEPVRVQVWSDPGNGGWSVAADWARRPDRQRETLATLRGRKEACAYAEETFGVRTWRGDGPRSRWGDGLRKRTTPCPLLASLRSPGPHYRGHHGLDVVLGRVPSFTPQVAT